VQARASPSPDLAAFYRAKPASYFSGARRDFVDRLPADAQAAVLEVGCGTGATGALARARGRAGHYVGIELDERAAREARQVLSEVLTGDIERLALPWRPGSFDALILSEVLEHLLAPWAALERLAALVRSGGLVLASSPNVAHWRVVRELLTGRFDLADSGVFDRTHLRWFTPSTFRAMFENAGFEVVRVTPVVPFSRRTRLISALTGGKLDHLFMSQICLQGMKR
jgi:SAM-dependent methyltransferase